VQYQGRYLSLIALCALLAAPTGAGAQETEETYQVVFTSIWSETTHPLGFPDNPHYSGLIGGTHDDGVVFWEPGQLASDGIESMAETGSKTLLQGEVEAAITAGTAEFVLSGGNINPSPGSVSLAFTVSESHPLVSLVSMVAPSPDWFVGVHGLNLFQGDQWVDELVVDLYVYDAGTDSGTFYEAPNEDTNPPEPIALLESGSFAESGFVGTFTFTRGVVDVPPGTSVPAITLLAPVRPNPSAGIAHVSFDLAEASSITLDVFDVAGRRVRRLADGAFEGGAHVATWDGRLTSGSRAPAGVYLVRLVAAGESATRRVVLSR
jgi:hypothetical protein